MKNEITDYQLEKAKEQGAVEALGHSVLAAAFFMVIFLALNWDEVTKKPYVNTTKVVFENSKVICFSDPSVGTWCVDMTLEDVHMPLLKH